MKENRIAEREGIFIKNLTRISESGVADLERSFSGFVVMSGLYYYGNKKRK